MSASSDLARSSAKSGANVLWGLIFSSIISAIGTIIVGNTLGDEEFGLIAIVLSGPTMITYMRDLGIDAAIIRYATQYRTENSLEKLKNIVIVGTSFEVILGTVFTIASFLLSGFMGTLLERPTLIPLIQISSLTILATGLVKAAQSVFIGYERMELHSLTLVIQSILKTSFMIGLITLMHGAYGAVVGQIVGLCGAALVSLALLYLTIMTKFRKEKSELHFISTMKTMLTYGLPLSIVSILGGVLSQFFIFVSAIHVSDQMMSNYSMALYFATLVSLFATSVVTVMFPTFSKIKGKDDSKTLQSVFQYSVKYTALIIVPLAFAIIALSTPGVQTLFQDDYVFTPQFLSLYCLIFLYSALGNLSVSSLINSQGETKVNMKIAVLTFVFGVSLSLVLIPTFKIIGLIVSIILSGLPGLIVSLIWIKKHFNATLDWISSIKIISISALSAVITYFVINQFNLTRWIGLIVGAPLFFATYIVTAPLTGAITYEDTKNLKDAVKSLGPLAVVINLLLYPIEKIAKAKQKNKNK